MGRATRWLKALLSGGGGSSSSSSGKKKKAACSSTAPSEPAWSVVGGGAKDKKGSGWGFARSFRDKDAATTGSGGVGVGLGGGGVAEPGGGSRELLGGKGSSCRESPGATRSRRVPADPSCCSLSSSSSASARPGGCAAGRVAAVPDEEEQSKRAIAVAAATAAAAEAAVAAAQAAAAVVRLTSRGGAYGPAATSSSTPSSARRSEEWASVKIQSAFRGYLARRALKALKGLVKIQALVRGHIVRKQAAETMRCMQALVRVQARARAGRGLDNKHHQLQSSSSRESTRLHHHYQHLGQGYYSTHHESKDGINGLKSGTARSNSLNRNGSRSKSAACAVDPTALQSPGWNWLDRWMEERYWDSRETLSRSGGGQTTDDERNEKILEVDAGVTRPVVINHASTKSIRNGHHHHCSVSEQKSRSYPTMMGDSPSKDSTVVQHSIPSPSSVDQHPQQQHQQQLLGNLRCFPLEPGMEYSDSPQFFSASSRHGSSRRGPFTPSRSECSRSYFSGYADYPNYMSNTESSKAKVRSQSAPKQRPDYDKSTSLKKQQQQLYQQYQYLNPAAASGPLSSSSSMQLKFAGKAYPGSGRLDRMGMPIKI